MLKMMPTFSLLAYLYMISKVIYYSNTPPLVESLKSVVIVLVSSLQLFLST